MQTTAHPLPSFALPHISKRVSARSTEWASSYRPPELPRPSRDCAHAKSDMRHHFGNEPPTGPAFQPDSRSRGALECDKIFCDYFHGILIFRLKDDRSEVWVQWLEADSCVFPFRIQRGCLLGSVSFHGE